MPEQHSMFDASDGISSATNVAVGELQRDLCREMYLYLTLVLDTQHSQV